MSTLPTLRRDELSPSVLDEYVTLTNVTPLLSASDVTVTYVDLVTALAVPVELTLGTWPPSNGEYYIDIVADDTKLWIHSSQIITTGDLLVVEHNTQMGRSTTYSDNGDIFFSTLNADMDLLHSMVSELSRDHQRSIRINDGEITDPDLQLPYPIVGGQVIGWNVAGDALAYYGSTDGAVLLADLDDTGGVLNDIIQFNGADWERRSTLTIASATIPLFFGPVDFNNSMQVDGTATFSHSGGIVLDEYDGGFITFNDGEGNNNVTTLHNNYLHTDGTYTFEVDGIDALVLTDSTGNATFAGDVTLSAEAPTLTLGGGSAGRLVGDPIGTIDFYNSDSSGVGGVGRVDSQVRSVIPTGGSGSGGVLEFYTRDQNDASLVLALTIDEEQLATFAGDVDVDGGALAVGLAGTASVANIKLYGHSTGQNGGRSYFYNGGGGAGSTWIGQQIRNGNFYLDSSTSNGLIVTNGTNGNTTFAGDLDVDGGTLSLGGTAGATNFHFYSNSGNHGSFDFRDESGLNWSIRDSNGGTLAIQRYTTVREDMLSFATATGNATFAGEVEFNGGIEMTGTFDTVGNGTFSANGTNVFKVKTDSRFRTMGGVQKNVTHVTGTTYTLSSTDDIIYIWNATSSAITLPAVSAGEAGTEYTLICAHGTIRPVVTPDGSDTIDGASSFTFTSQWETIRIVNLGTQGAWVII